MDPIEALTTCRTYEAACDAAGVESIEQVVRSCAWSILAAPDIYLLVSEWTQIRRLDDAEQDLIESRVRLMTGIRDPEAVTLIELKGPPDKADTDGDVYRTIKTGPDVLSVRASALTKAVEAHVKLATGRMKLHESLNRRIQAVVWRLDALRSKRISTDQARDILIGYMASTDPRLEVALAFPRVYAASGTPKRDPGTGEAIDPRTGRLESESIEHALPAVMVELDQLRAARQRALSAGDFGAAVALGAEVRGVESRKQGNDADGAAALEALDRHPALVGRT